MILISGCGGGGDSSLRGGNPPSARYNRRTFLCFFFLTSWSDSEEWGEWSRSRSGEGECFRGRLWGFSFEAVEAPSSSVPDETLGTKGERYQIPWFL